MPPLVSTLSHVDSLYRQHGPELLNYFARRCPEQAAHDLLQEVFLQVLRAPADLAGVSMPRAWLFGIARNLLAQHYRKQRDPLEAPDFSSPASQAEANDPRLDAVRDAIATLAPDLKETLELRLEGELSYEEIAEVLGIPVGTVRSRLHNAVRRLRDRLTNKEPS
jgi:RNA polymerase sigma-70 factor, ECF subfamily